MCIAFSTLSSFLFKPRRVVSHRSLTYEHLLCVFTDEFIRAEIFHNNPKPTGFHACNIYMSAVFWRSQENTSCIGLSSLDVTQISDYRQVLYFDLV
ncbi:hypothetical protein Q7C36_020009 [Tachysurus vachellii]|uniref:Uncharacterized protein n=1 Tax=Tachysurus vachellii TaxID=175792 RepID=A0AA88LSU9_TACVA|nr:hypothetical protein Q7C36_020009 [Tachysurus vachellii]